MSIRRFLGGCAAALVLLCSNSALATDGLRFYAVLSGDQEVPPADTPSSARALVVFDKGFTKAWVRVDLKGPIQVVAGHFHCGRAGTNAGVAFGLLNPGPLTVFEDPTRLTLTNDAFTGADCVPSVGRPVNNLAALALAMRDGLIYLNLHSAAFPAGEVRGQMLEFGR